MTRHLACLVLAAVLLLFAPGETAFAESLRLTVDRLDSFTIFKQRKTFGPLEWRGGLSLASEDTRFGGLSGLEMSNDGAKLLAVGDAGFWFRAEASYQQGELAGLASPEIASIVGPDGKRQFAFTIKRFGNYAITDLAVLPNSDIVILERSFEGLLPGMALRLIRTNDIVSGGAVAPELLFEARAPFHAIDNMEGIAVSRSPEGETRLTFVSNDNFNQRLQRTLILQFALKLPKITE